MVKFLGIHEETKEKVAIKQIPKTGEQDIDSVYNEINIQKNYSIHIYVECILLFKIMNIYLL